MGGGGAMRAAAKVAGSSAFTCGFRASTAVADSPVTVAARNLVRPACSERTGLKFEQAVQRPARELSDWELLGAGERLEDEDETASFVGDKNGSGLQSQRFVFGPVPTFEETKEATSELSDAIEKVYLLSPESTGSSGSLSSLHETKACISHQASVPQGAMQAFKFLKENPVAQTVVASIASDPNVWDAVSRNPTFVEYLESLRQYADLDTQEPFKGKAEEADTQEPFKGEAEEADTQEPFKGSAEAKEAAQDSPKRCLHNDDAEEPGKPDGFMGFVEGVKITVVEMVGRLTSFVESLFNVPDMEEKGDFPFDSPKAFIAGGIMALAMMVIMVVLMKRN